MKRRGSPGVVRFVTFSCAQRKRLLATPQIRDLVTSRLREWIEPHDIAVHAWVVLSNHIHLLLTPRSGDLGRALAVLKKDIAIEVLPHLRDSPRLWQAGLPEPRRVAQVRKHLDRNVLLQDRKRATKIARSRRQE